MVRRALLRELPSAKRTEVYLSGEIRCCVSFLALSDAQRTIADAFFPVLFGKGGFYDDTRHAITLKRVCLADEEFAAVQKLLAKAKDGQMSEGVVVQALSDVAQGHDRRTHDHTRRMVRLTEATARVLGRPDEELHLMRLAVQLHDIGKIGIPDTILNKPGPLTEKEWAVMSRHPEIGRQVQMQAGGVFVLLSRIVGAHQERWDGEGYPYGLAREATTLGYRILAVVDAYDAMTSQRPYREALPTASCALLLNDDNWTNALTALTILQADEKRVLFSSLSHLRLL